MTSRDDNYDVIKVLGKGGFGWVELWRQRFDEGRLVVAKRVYVGEMTKKEVDNTRQEARVLKALKHPHIVQYIGSWINRQREDLIIVQHYCAGGDLGHLVAERSKKQEFFTEAHIMEWLAQLTHALQYCHKRARILHRDLKPNNIFLEEDQTRVLLGDFGIAKSLGSTASLCQTFIGTQAYMSPEVTRMQNYGPKSDIWALGAIVYEVCTLKKLYDSKDLMALMQSIANPDDAPCLSEESGYSIELRELCAAMLVKDATARPSLDVLLQDQALLRLAVLQLERELGWEDSLVPERGVDAAGSNCEPLERAEARQKVRQVFRSFDRDSDGRMDRDELAGLLHSLNSRWDAGVANLLLKAADSNGDAYIDYEEFVDWLLDVNDEWDEVRQAVLDVEEPPEPRVATAWAERAEQPTESSSLAEAAAHARERLLRRRDCAADPDSSATTEAQLFAAAEVQDLVQLTLRRQELEQLLEQVPVSEPDLDALCSIDFSSWSVGMLKEFISSRGGSLLGVTEKAELVALCAELHGAEASATGEADEALDSALQQKVQLLDARLRCVDILQGQADETDPIELAIALRQAKRMQLAEEPCGQALASHSERLGMHAEDVTHCGCSSLSELERSMELLEALASHGGELLKGSSRSPHSLAHANGRLREKRKEKLQVGVRSHCGPFVKTLSVRCDLPFEQLKAQLAQHWDRPLEALRFSCDGSALQSDDQWRHCLQSRSSAEGPVEIALTLDRSKLATPKVRRKRAQRKRQSTETPKGAVGAESGRPKTGQLAAPAKRHTSLAGLAASGNHWRGRP